MVVGVICLDSRGMIVQVNARAREILREGAGLVERRGVLRAKQTADDERLSRLLAHALSQPGRPGTSGSMTVARSAQRPRLALHVIPAEVRDVGSRSDWSPGWWWSSTRQRKPASIRRASPRASASRGRRVA